MSISPFERGNSGEVRNVTSPTPVVTKSANRPTQLLITRIAIKALSPFVALFCFFKKLIGSLLTKNQNEGGEPLSSQSQYEEEELRRPLLESETQRSDDPMRAESSAMGSSENARPEILTPQLRQIARPRNLLKEIFAKPKDHLQNLSLRISIFSDQLLGKDTTLKRCQLAFLNFFPQTWQSVERVEAKDEHLRTLEVDIPRIAIAIGGTRLLDMDHYSQLLGQTPFASKPKQMAELMSQGLAAPTNNAIMLKAFDLYGDKIGEDGGILSFHQVSGKGLEVNLHPVANHPGLWVIEGEVQMQIDLVHPQFTNSAGYGDLFRLVKMQVSAFLPTSLVDQDVWQVEFHHNAAVPS